MPVGWVHDKCPRMIRVPKHDVDKIEASRLEDAAQNRWKGLVTHGELYMGAKDGLQLVEVGVSGLVNNPLHRVQTKNWSIFGDSDINVIGCEKRVGYEAQADGSD